MAKLPFKSGPYNGKSVTLPMGKSLTMGRNRDLELPLPDLKLSRRHCQIVFSGGCILKDLGSTNGTMINGTRLNGEVELNDFDRIVLGDTEIEFHYAEKVPLPVTFDPDNADPFGLDDEQPADVPLANPPQNAPGAQAAIIVPPKAAAAQPVQQPAAVAVLDPLAEALSEMCQPLPPEPFSNQPDTAAANRPMVVFCEGCEGSVPLLDLDLGTAREIEGKIFCKDCLAKGVKVGTEAPAPAAPPAPAPAAAKPQAPRPTSREKSMDDILAALDNEAVVVDTSLKRGSTILDEDEAQRKMNEMKKVQQQVATRAPARPASKDVKEELGEEFEEIG